MIRTTRRRVLLATGVVLASAYLLLLDQVSCCAQSSPSGRATTPADSSATRTEENQRRDVEILQRPGLDPQGFRNAEHMFVVAQTRPPDAEMTRLIEALEQVLVPGRSVDERVEEFLVQLNPYRCVPEVQACVARWAETFAMRSQSNPTSAGIGPFKEANAEYEKGRFEEAAKRYRQLLRRFPSDLDVRNNLALARMHCGHDLLAQVELEALLRLRPNYLPALINLTVVYERSRRRDKARAIAKQAQANKEVPMAAFNWAWYLNLDRNYKEVEELLKPWVEDSKVAHINKYRQLYRRNAEQMRDKK